jgi:hypothetical protein
METLLSVLEKGAAQRMENIDNIESWVKITSSTARTIYLRRTVIST